ncbi:ATP-binding protein [uncultured Cellulomonas sp.]|uniref:ATP-binding protein n=1 Tax=uncultured Cellulomonas sp. TaxID=189682 RepID=UPI0026183F0C|nr:ATP-binding protein [uncultured Cellulomonas sp.]
MELVLEAERFAARTGRRWVMDAVRGAGELDRSAGELLELLTGELLANAVIHGPAAGSIVVTVSRDGGRVRVAVRDQSPDLPRLTEASPTALGGRGVALVDALSSGWGVEEHAGSGKTVWFTLDLPSE